MTRLISAIKTVNDDERGHVEIGVPALIAGIAAITLSIGAAADSDVITIISGVVLGVTILASSVLRHRQIDYSMWERLDRLEK